MPERNVILGVSGSVAAYKACDIARELMRRGCVVRACLTDSAANFVSSALFEALTGQPCLADTFDEPEIGRMAHIEWAREADILLVAPATANTMAKLASGFADDMLSTIALVFDGPLVVAPAMNPSMYSSDPVMRATQLLKARSAVFVEPEEGVAACGEMGQGRLASVDAIVTAATSVLGRSRLLKGKRVLITSGPTQEPIDDVRYLTNRSSGKMGAALARAALLMGAEVTVISGPVAVAYPLEASLIRVRTAEEMLAAALVHAVRADLVVGASAVADFRPSRRVAGKIRRTDAQLTINLTPNPDIIAQVAQTVRPNVPVIAFAAEPDAGFESARSKIASKGVHAIAINDVSRIDVGFEADDNELTLLFADGRSAASGKQSKLSCALWLLELIAESVTKGESKNYSRTIPN